jgi:hypothetical protein
MSIFDLIGQTVDPDGLMSVIADDADVLRTTARTTTLFKGRRVPIRASIGGKNAIPGVELTAFATLQSAHLHRLSVLDHKSLKTGETGPLVTGIFKPVKIDIEIVADNEILSLEEFLMRWINASAKTPLTIEQMPAKLAELGINLDSGLSYFWQHFNAKPNGDNGYNALIEKFLAFGAVDAMHTVKTENSRIKQSYQMPEMADGTDLLGPEVVSFEIGRADRGKSQTEQGFIDIVDSVTSSMYANTKLRKESKDILNNIARVAASEGWPQERIAAEKSRAEMLESMSKSWNATWTGKQQRIVVNPKDRSEKTPENVFDAVSAGCGRFGLVLANEQTFGVDLWLERNRANTTDSVAVKSSSDEVLTSDETAITWQ